jgi:hypothetical protein
MDAVKAPGSSGELELIAAAVAAGQRDGAIAEALGLSHRTFYRRKALPETQELIAEHRREAAQQIRDGVVGAGLSKVVGLEGSFVLVDIPAEGVFTDYGEGPTEHDPSRPRRVGLSGIERRR